MGCVMGQLLVRSLDDDIIRALKLRASRHGRSVEAEHRAILEQALRPEQESFAVTAARLRATMPPSPLDSADLIRAERDQGLGVLPE